ncbi:hypothetical protein EPO33_03895 [Patescibacteria group bacterium]|nr:MAG: hypothetical protein EPO33_03895 [Patescibacteria group bacterium]
MDYADLLKSLGFNDSESRVYIASLELGPSPVQIVAKKAGFSRPSTYAAITGLSQKGLMSSYIRGKRKLFSAEPPDRLLHFVEEESKKMQSKVREIASVLNDLRLLQKGERPGVKFFEGVEGLRTILEDIAATKPATVDEMANIDAVKEIFSDPELRAIQDVLSKRKTPGRALLLGNVQRARPGVDVRVLPPKDFEFYGDLVIYGDKVAIVTFKGAIIGVVIDSAIAAQTLRALFDLAWRGAGGFPTFK